MAGDDGTEGEKNQKDPGRIKDTELKEKTFLTEDEAYEFCNVGKTTFRRAVTLGLIQYCIFPEVRRNYFTGRRLRMCWRRIDIKGLFRKI